ncbi:F/Y rich C-terminus-domain-containing protein [Lentinula aciculospora]|uniref:F/Y rich C-terminus-domain-containing protein n=1 Tax=Lentinula aciculospora TaxID=153920 RepID=A0A9W9DRV5_9AGAR|nr:F/Y rich C-terminus-domain-containing protein [Lentinula aciculospora]
MNSEAQQKVAIMLANRSVNGTTNPTIDPALQNQSQPRPTTLPSTSLSSNPYAMYLTNTRSGSGPAPAYSPFANPYYFLTLPPATISIPGIPIIYACPPPAAVPVPGPQSVMSSSLISSSIESRPAQSQTQGLPPSANSGADQNATNQPSSSRRLKSHVIVSKSYSIPTIPRDKHGQPMLPLNVGIMTVVRLGTVCTRDHFHSERYIFPVGYTVTRRYLSTIDPTSDVVYHCTILDGGDGPKFQIVPSDEPDKPLIASTATGAWSSIVRKANDIRKRQHSNSVSGPDFFGLSQNTIRHLIQQLPGAEKLAKKGTRMSEGENDKEEGKGSAGGSKRPRFSGTYVWQNYNEGGPLGGRHAAVIPALPDQYDSAQRTDRLYNESAGSESTPGRLHDVNGGATRSDSPSGTSATISAATDADGAPKGTGLSYYPPHVMAQAESRQPYYYTPHSNSPQSYYPAHPLQSLHQPYQPLQPPTSHPQPPLQHHHHVQATFASLLNSFASAQGAGNITMPDAVVVPTTLPIASTAPAPSSSNEGMEIPVKGRSVEHKQSTDGDSGEGNEGSRAEEIQADFKVPGNIVDSQHSPLQGPNHNQDQQE